jgi:coproporphyrinogen III oxidase-like Fe-S oxidoreductase
MTEGPFIAMRLNPLPTLFKFDRQLPIYNWLYPFEIEEKKVTDPLPVLEQINPYPRRRALYFHIPFCDTICSFCPFTRGEFDSEDEVDRYVRALLREIAIKREYPAFTATPVDAIYFGGGTPSVLRVEHIYQLGEALQRSFDLSQLKEWTFECEVKSVTLEKLKAFQDIGVTRISFGVQTLNPLYREIFTMTATVDQIRRVAAWVNERFPYTNADQIYCMPGQTLDDFLTDVDQILELGTTTVDYYPLNNPAAQVRMHRGFAERGMRPLSANARLSYRMFLNEYLRAQGYMPINGYSFTRYTPPAGEPRRVMYRDRVYCLYLDIAYGYADEHVDNYGAGAVGHYGPFNLTNLENRERYVARLLDKDAEQKPWFRAYAGLDAAEKGLVYFPHRGTLDKARIAWEQINPGTRAMFDESVTHGLAVDCGDHYELTETGFLFYVNYMYALMPPQCQQEVSEFIDHTYAHGRQPDDFMFYPRAAADTRNLSVVPAIPVAKP